MFTCFMMEFHFVLTSVWRSYLIGMFGFLFINLNMLICVVSLVSILNTYLCLQAQNWQWWWRAFFSGFSTTLFVLAYCVYHMIFEFGMDIFWSDVVFLLYSILVSNLFGLMCGTISLAASLIFVTLLYQQGKSD
jgi:transmembrane 9 superfamily protein 2/4